MFCSRCFDFRALSPEQMDKRWAIVACQCGTVEGRWTDPMRGLAIFREDGRDRPRHAWLIGIHNEFLLTEDPRLAHRVWDTAEGYLFKSYESPVIKVRPGQSSDTRFVSMELFERGTWPTDQEIAESWAT